MSPDDATDTSASTPHPNGNARPDSAGGARSTGRRIDPSGRHALFSTPPQAARDQLGPGNQKEGRQAFFSTGPRQAGTVVVICSSCHTRARMTLVDIGVRLLSISLWNPLRKHAHWIRCPNCHQHQWCQIAWNE